jgi:hypothetical protein
MPTAVAALPLVGAFQTVNSAPFPPSSLDPAVVTAGQIIPADTTITGLSALFTSTGFTTPLVPVEIQIALYNGMPGSPASPVPGVGCMVPLPGSIFPGLTSTCSEAAAVVLPANSIAYLVAYNTGPAPEPIQGQISTGLTTD